MSTKIKTELNNEKFLYGYKNDLAEINRFNYRILIRDYFHLTTKKITLMAMLLTLNLVLTIFSKYVLGLMPIAGFFVIEVSFVTILMFALINNFFYTFIFLELTIWLRLALGSEPIGLLAMNLVDGFFLIIFCFAVFCFKRVIVKQKSENWIKKLFVFEVVVLSLIILLTSAFAVFINYSFILQLYFPQWTKKEATTLLPLIFALNIAKYFLNVFLYLLTFKPLVILARRYQA